MPLFGSRESQRVAPYNRITKVPLPVTDSALLNVLRANLDALVLNLNALGANLDELGANWDALGANLNVLGASLNALGANLGAKVPLSVPTWTDLGLTWTLLGPT